MPRPGKIVYTGGETKQIKMTSKADYLVCYHTIIFTKILNKEFALVEIES